jgi:hypothetical protein
MADVFKIAVEIAMKNNVSSLLKVIQRDLMGLHSAIDLTTNKFSAMQTAVIGAGGAMAGLGMLAAFKDIASAGGRVIDAQNKMLQIGISQRDVAIETANAYANINIAGSTPSGNINNETTLYAVLGTLKGANAALPAFDKAQFALASRGIDTSQLDQVVKALDLMGAFNTNGQIDPSKFAPAMATAVSAMLTTNGLLTGQGIYQAVRLSGPAATAMDEDAYFKSMTEVLLALGNRGARGLEYGATTFLGGQMSKNTAMMFDRLGLTNSGDYTHEGGRWSLKSGAIQGSDLLQTGNIVGWIQKYFLPDVAKSGLTAFQAAATLPQTLQLLISTVSAMTPQIARSVQQQAQAGTVDPYTIAQQSWTGTLNDLSQAIGGKGGLWEALGTPAAGIAIPILKDLTSGIRDFTHFLGDNPALASGIDKVLLGLGAGLTVLGSAALVGSLAAMAGPGGLLATLAISIGGISSVLIAGNWKTITGDFVSGMTNIEHSIQRFLYDLEHPGQALKDLTPPPAAPGTPQVGYGRYQPRVITARQGGTSMTWGDAASDVGSFFGGIQNWIDQGAPVTVTNTGDLAKGANTYITGQLTKPSRGGINGVIRHHGLASAAMQGGT